VQALPGAGLQSTANSAGGVRFRSGSEMSAFPPKSGHSEHRVQCLLSAMCGRLLVGKSKRHVASLVGAAMCSAC
jgi:hypothetical protein